MPISLLSKTNLYENVVVIWQIEFQNSQIISQFYTKKKMKTGVEF